MPGQFNTRRNPDTGRLEKVPEAERGALQAAAQGITPPPPAAGSVTQQDVDFVNGGQEPPPLPEATPGQEPPPLPPIGDAFDREKAEAARPSTLAASGVASAGVSAGRILGPAAAAVGAGLSFAASQSLKQAPVGSLEGGGQTGGGDREVLRQLLAVQRGIARVGSPIKDAITTKSAGSRL